MIRLASPMAMLLAMSAPASASEAPPRQSSPSVAAGSSPGTPPPPRELGLGAIQLAAGYAAELGGVGGALAVGLSPKGLGFHSDLGTLVFVGILGPALAGGAVCGSGLFSHSYRGRCSTTLLGAYVGAAVGALIGVALAPRPGPDDTSEFEVSISSLIGVLAVAPIGAVAGYHLGKQEIARDPASLPVPVQVPPPTSAIDDRSSHLAFKESFTHIRLPLLTLRW